MGKKGCSVWSAVFGWLVEFLWLMPVLSKTDWKATRCLQSSCISCYGCRLACDSVSLVPQSNARGCRTPQSLSRLVVPWGCRESTGQGWPPATRCYQNTFGESFSGPGPLLHTKSTALSLTSATWWPVKEPFQTHFCLLPSKAHASDHACSLKAPRGLVWFGFAPSSTVLLTRARCVLKWGCTEGSPNNGTVIVWEFW